MARLDTEEGRLADDVTALARRAERLGLESAARHLHGVAERLTGGGSVRPKADHGGRVKLAADPAFPPPVLAGRKPITVS